MQIGRSVQIVTQETTEWPRFMAEENERAALIRYGITLIIAANVAQAIGSMIVTAGFAFIGLWAPYFLAMHALRLAFEITALFFVPKILSTLAPSFGGSKNELSALKLYVYAMTPAWLGMVLMFIPILGWIAALAGGIYAFYLFWMHSAEAMTVPEDKKVGYVLFSILIVAVIYWIITLIVTAIVTAMFLGGLYSTGWHSGPGL